MCDNIVLVVVSSGIEPESRASETLILSIVLRDRGAVDSRQSQSTKTAKAKVMSLESEPRVNSHKPVSRSDGLRLTACIC